MPNVTAAAAIVTGAIADTHPRHAVRAVQQLEESGVDHGWFRRHRCYLRRAIGRHPGGLLRKKGLHGKLAPRSHLSSPACT